MTGGSRAPTRFLAAAVLALSDAATAQEAIELPAEDRWLDADFEEVYRVGSADGEAWEAFGEVSRLGFDGDGNLYIFDRMVGRIIVVDPRGDLLGEFGRRGDGPGEFRAALEMAVMRDGSIAIADPAHHAYLIFDSNGEFTRNVRMDGEPADVTVPRMWPEAGGESVVVGTRNAGAYQVFSEESAPREFAVPTVRPIQRLILAGDVVTREPIAEGWAPPRTEAAGGEGPRRRAFEPALHVAVLPGRMVAFSDSFAYAIKIASAEAGILRILTRPLSPKRVTERMREAERNRRRKAGGEFLRGFGIPADIAGSGIRERQLQKIDALEFFEEIPIVRYLMTSWSGTIWVQRSGDEPHTSGPIDVLAPDGRYIGSYATGATGLPRAFGPGGLAAFVERDAFDVQTVVVRRLPLRVGG